MLVFGHTHKPWVREYGGVRFVNCGSVGKPKDGDPRAAFAILSASERGVDVTIERVAYDAESVAADGRRRAAERVRRQAPDRRVTRFVNPPLVRRLLAEYLGSALLAALVIGSGVAAQQLSSDPGLQLLENAAAPPPAFSRSSSSSDPSPARTSTPSSPSSTLPSAA